MRGVIFYISMMICFAANGQPATKILTIDEFAKTVRTHHPVFYQARLVQDMADANLMMARGGFDPKLGASFDGKSFDEKNYFNLFSAGVKVPTWIGVDLKAGYDQSSGIFLDESDNLPSSGLIYAGISVPLGKGLIIDERRAAVRKGQIFIRSSVQMQRQMRNEILYAAMDAYIKWQESFYSLQVAREGVEIAETRLQASISSFVNGDKPAIDTLETFISLQNREITVSKIEQDLVKAVFELNNFLWLEGNIPLELGDDSRPEGFNAGTYSLEVDSLFLIKDILLSTHPEVLEYEFKLDELDIDRRLALESFKPDLRLDYNPLYEARTEFLPTQNYKVGVSASYPILIRKERGKLGLTRAKIADTGYELSLKETSLRNKLEMYYELQDQIGQQNDIIAEAVRNYQRMVDAENRKFEIGESSVFLINTREGKYLDSRYKLISGQGKLIKSRLLYFLFSGQLNEVI